MHSSHSKNNLTQDLNYNIECKLKNCIFIIPLLFRENKRFSKINLSVDVSKKSFITVEANRNNLIEGSALSWDSKNSKGIGKILNNSKIISFNKMDEKMSKTAAKQYKSILLKNK